MDVIFFNVRMAFPKIWTPEQFNGTGKASYSAQFIIDGADKVNMQKAVAAIRAVATEKWKESAGEVLAVLKAKDDICLHDGNSKSKFPGFAGNQFMSARTQMRPVIVDRNKAPLTEADGRPYSGCYVNVCIDVWAEDSKYGKGINGTLKSIQFFADGEAFSGSTPGTADVFETYGDDPSAPVGAGAKGEVDPLFGAF